MFSSVLLPLLFFSIILNSQPMTLLPTSVRKWKHSEENFHRLPSPHLASCRHWYLPILLSCHCSLFFPRYFIKLVYLLAYYIAFCLSYSGSFLEQFLFSLQNWQCFTLSYIILITMKICCYFSQKGSVCTGNL